MAFTFLHTGDWHIGKPFGSLPGEQAAKLRGARLDAIDRLAETAIDGRASHILVAGDLFDRPSLADRDVRGPIEQMRAYPQLAWHIIPGNHDPATSGGVWERVRRGGLPGNIHLHLESFPIELAQGCWLMPAPLAAKSMSHDPTAWMDAAPTPAGALRIGLAHGSVQGFGSEHSASIEIAPDRPRRAGLDYLALGDWHGTRQIGPRAWYAGTPEPDSFLDNAPGHALLVTLEGAEAPPMVQRREIGTYRWLERQFGTARTSDLAALEGEVEGLGARVRHVLLSVEVSGRVTLEQDREIRSRLDRLDSRVFYLARRLERMTLGFAVDDIDRLGTGPLRVIGSELATIAADSGNPECATAERALRHLFDLAEALGDETGRQA